MATDQTRATDIRPARDWRKLAREARAGGYSTIKGVAVFIADNTKDVRADDPFKPHLLAAGYHAALEAWLQEEGL